MFLLCTPFCPHHAYKNHWVVGRWLNKDMKAVVLLDALIEAQELVPGVELQRQYPGLVAGKSPQRIVLGLDPLPNTFPPARASGPSASTLRTPHSPLYLIKRRTRNKCQRTKDGVQMTHSASLMTTTAQFSLQLTSIAYFVATRIFKIKSRQTNHGQLGIFWTK